MRSMIESSLLEQMQFSNREIAVRKRLFGFTDNDVANLTACRELIASHVDEICEEFYRQQVAEPEIAMVIGDHDTLQRLKGSMRHYILELFQGYYDEEYVNKRLRVGKIHKRIGVTPKLYMSAVWLLMNVLEQFIEAEACGVRGDVSCADIRYSLRKLLLFDTQLVFDTYINSMTAEILAAKREVEVYAESLEQRIAERTRQLHEQALRDPLTGLFNQRAFYDNLHRLLAIAERTHGSVCLVYFDLNGFKQLNDSLGHKAGDALLVAVAQAMNASLRASDLACRYGGDEFCIILPNSDLASAEAYCQRLIEEFNRKETGGVTFSMGVVESGGALRLEMNEMVKLADDRMYLAKELSRAEPGHHVQC